MLPLWASRFFTTISYAVYGLFFFEQLWLFQRRIEDLVERELVWLRVGTSMCGYQYNPGRCSQSMRVTSHDCLTRTLSRHGVEYEITTRKSNFRQGVAHLEDGTAG
jgi:hypothetical protein